MLKGRGRDPRGGISPAPGHPIRPVAMMQPPRTPLPQRPPMKPEPDYEVVEFPSDQYMNAKLQPPPPPPPRPPTGHPAQAGASCGLCGGGGARVRCAECGRRALCASCDDMYHRHPKRRHHQRQALSPSQLSEDRPPLPPKTVAPPVPPPRRHKLSASPKPPTPLLDHRHATLGHPSLPSLPSLPQPHAFSQPQPLPAHIQVKMAPPSANIGSMPFLNTMPHPAAPAHPQMQSNTMGHLNPAWNRPRGSLQGFNMPQMANNEAWESSSAGGGGLQPGGWSRPLRRGASVLELGGAGGGSSCSGCAHCAPVAWRYGSCASLDHPWAPAGWPAPPCCAPHPHLAPHHQHHLAPQTPQPYRRADSRTMSRTASRAGSRAASPAQSVRSRASRRNKHRTPSPPLPSSDADSESESEEEPPPPRRGSRSGVTRDLAPPEPAPRDPVPREPSPVEAPLAPLPPAPAAPWHCEHCTFVNEPGVRVCAVCCRTPTAPPRVADLAADMEGLHISKQPSSPPRVRESPRVEIPVEKPKRTESMKSNRERTSTGCGPSPPRERRAPEPTGRLVTPTREHNGAAPEPRMRHDMAVGPSPPRDVRNGASQPSPLREPNKTVRVSPYRETKEAPKAPQRHSVSVGPSPPRHSVSVGPSPPRHNVSVGPSPPRDATRHNVSAGPSPPRERIARETSNINFQKKSAGTSPPPDVRAGSRSPAPTMRTKVSNTGTSPPPQSISTQTYEESPAWERGAGGGAAGAARSRRRLRDEARRERSRSRHSLSSDTRESERSVRTAGAGWEWRERESSPPAGEWGGRLARRASHLDLRRRQPRRSSLYGSEATSPEPRLGRAASVEAGGARRGLELARLLADAERLGYDAAEVQVALGASPEAPLEWLRSRWAGLAGAVRGAAARLAPHAPLAEREARAALARHRGAVWPAVTECVDALRTQGEAGRVSSAARVRGRVWGSPAGADDDAAAPRARAEYYSSDEFDPPEDPYSEWALSPAARGRDSWPEPPPPLGAEEAARALRSLLAAGEGALLRDLLAPERARIGRRDPPAGSPYDLIQSENDFIDAYNALTRASPLPNIGPTEPARSVDMDHDYSRRDDEMRSDTEVNENFSKTRIRNEPDRHETHQNGTTESSLRAASPKINLKLQEPKKAKIKIIKSESQNSFGSINKNEHNETVPDIIQTQRNELTSPTHLINDKETAPAIIQNLRNELKSPTQPLHSQKIKQAEEKSNNLNDIVDDTQRLIQQMKDEINSDITSLDEGHAQTSQSERDSSSNDEREESSYSETDEETDNMSSDEKEMSSTEEYEEEIVDESKDITTFPNRTSSEDNEQFEEALDNLDHQIEDVKHANIQILDSIARSLQEEHTIVVEINEAMVEHLDKKEEVNRTKLKASKRPDSNNNKKKFVAVNSFDEIYAELNTSINEVEEIHQPEPVQPATAKVTETPAVVEIIEPKVLLTKHALNELTFKIVMPTKLLISERIDPIFSAVIETLEESETVEPETETAFIEIANSEDLTYGRNNSKSSSPSSDSESSQKDDVVTNSNPIGPAIDTVEIKIEDPIPAPVIDKEPIIESVERRSEHNTPRSSAEKVLESPPKSENTKTVTVKSNIPKPVKTTPNIKAKVDKLAPKVLASKVPVRRGSLKQYPAPAPPKTHFGNVQSGHVKQLQSKIFNDTTPAKSQKPVTIDVKPSTSTATLSKKKPAPQPPTKAEQNQAKQSTPPQASPPKEKRNYFRETCRTEDEWTDSDSEDSQSQIVRLTENNEEPQAPPSPPPPPTVRRVSGQIIDLATVQLPEGSPERQARMLLAGGALETWEQARLAVELVGRGAAPAGALLAALDCADLPAALAYLHQDCELCATRDLPEHEMVSMLSCTHRCCRECARLYFTVQVTERTVADCVCPYCKLPELEALPEDAWLDYFAHLDIMLKALLEPPVHELFQRKLRDRTLARDPNFRWCVECSSGFFVHPKQKKLRCPECRSVTCASCRKPWSSNHEGLSCSQYATWLEDNDPERAAAAVQQHLRDNGLECPRCRFKYSLSRGGCMHFTCTQCKFEFCYGCGKPFTMGARCGLSEYCAKLGLHAHHPRNCLFYLRDKEPHELQTLLQMNNVTYETQAAEGSAGRCPIQLQRETPGGLVDGVCGSEAPPNFAGLCKNHYLEYLSRLVRARGVDPLPLLAVDDLETLVRRAALRPPPRPYGSLEGVYRRALGQVCDGACCCRPHYTEYLAGLARALDPIPIMDVPELVAELRRRALPLPERGPWDTDPVYAGMCAEIVREKIPLD